MAGRGVFIFMVLAAAAFAQRGGRGGSGMSDAGNYNPAPAQPKTKLDLFAAKLKLSSEQVEQVNAILVATTQQMAPVRAQIDKSRGEIASAMLTGKSPEDLNHLLEAHTALEAQMDAVEADTFAKVLALLKPNQQAKAAQAFEFLAGAFDRGPGHGGGGRRGR